MTATGDHYITFYVVSQNLPEGSTPKATLAVVDNSAKPQVTNAWLLQPKIRQTPLKDPTAIKTATRQESSRLERIKNQT